MTGPARFDPVASRYERDSSAQKAAADRLLALAEVRPRESVLDVGCGTGHLAERLASAGATVIGIDPSSEMIAAARARGIPGARFERLAAEDLAFEAAFDAAVSNSALQWFHDAPRALLAIRRALRAGGRLALQAPATARYVPEFVDAMAEVAADPRTAPTFAGWRSPWLFLETADAYAELVARAGFRVASAAIEELQSCVDVDGAMRIFGSAAEAGYLGAASYASPVPAGYADAVRELVRASFARRAEADGTFELRFRRVYLLAHPG